VLHPFTMNIFEENEKLKSAIGSFIIAFSELEFALAHICIFTEFDLLRANETAVEYLGMSLDLKKRKIKEYISKYQPDLKERWQNISDEIARLNKHRRYVAHGVHVASVSDSLNSSIKVGKQMESEELTVEKLNQWRSDLSELNTGQDGVNGVFMTDFKRLSIDRWNKHVSNEHKIVYKINGEIVSEWKG